MNSIEVTNRLRPPSAGPQRSATLSPTASELAPPPARDRLYEMLPLIDVVPVAGPPVIFVLGPWLLLVLMLIGPFLLVLTLVLAAAIFIAIATAVLALPYLLVRHLRKPYVRRTRQPLDQSKGTAPCTPRSFSSTAPLPSPPVGIASSTRSAAPVIR